MKAPSAESERRPGQYSLRRLFLATTCIAATCGLYHWFGLLPTIAILCIAAWAAVGYLAKRFFGGNYVWSMFATGLLGLLLLASIAPAFQRGSTCSPRSQCLNNLKQIGLGLQIYADVNGCFPPAYVADAEGRPTHSWRVLILPYIEQKPLYKRYDFNEPWNGPHNRLLAKSIPPCFRCPGDPSLPGSANTSYVAITGQQTIWADDIPPGLDDISDGTSNTLAVVEIAGMGINWMEARDLPFSALNLGVNAPQGGGISSTHPGAANVVFCDGATRTVQSTIPVDILKAFATKSAGETLGGEY